MLSKVPWGKASRRGGDLVSDVGEVSSDGDGGKEPRMPEGWINSEVYWRRGLKGGFTR